MSGPKTPSPNPEMQRRARELAARLSALRASEPATEGLVSVAAGALYGLISAMRLGYSNAPHDMVQYGHVRNVAKALARGHVPTTKTYLAGYYLNDALLRLDIAFENAVRHLTRCTDYESAKDLVNLAVAKGHDRGRFRGWLLIRKEMNGLKHKNPEQIARRKRGETLDCGAALSAAEQLVLLIELLIPGDTAPLCLRK